MSNLINKIKSIFITPTPTFEPKIPDTSIPNSIETNTPTFSKEQEIERSILLKEVDDMFQELRTMPRKFRTHKQNHPFLNEFMRQVEIRNGITLYCLKNHPNPSMTNDSSCISPKSEEVTVPHPNPHKPSTNDLNHSHLAARRSPSLTRFSTDDLVHCHLNTRRLRLLPPLLKH